jgi:hypothetical protein
MYSRSVAQEKLNHFNFLTTLSSHSCQPSELLQSISNHCDGFTEGHRKLHHGTDCLQKTKALKLDRPFLFLYATDIAS